MKLRIQLDGYNLAQKALAAAALGGREATFEYMNEVGRLTKDEAERVLRSPGRSGQTYRVPLGRGGPRVLHTASAPGEPPARLTGALADSLRVDKASARQRTMTVSANTPYARILELGGVNAFGRIAPRPYMFDAFVQGLRDAEGAKRKIFLAKLTGRRRR